jgi:hypothetical protein
VIIRTGVAAPPVDGIDLLRSQALVFYMPTCSVTEMAAAPLARFGAAYAGSVTGVGQDPQDVIDGFAAMLGWSFPQTPDPAPYVASDAYGISSSPTVVVIDDTGTVADVVESWDRDGMNRVSATLAELLGVEPVLVSTADDGLPDFKPG